MECRNMVGILLFVAATTGTALADKPGELGASRRTASSARVSTMRHHRRIPFPKMECNVFARFDDGAITLVDTFTTTISTSILSRPECHSDDPFTDTFERVVDLGSVVPGMVVGIGAYSQCDSLSALLANSTLWVEFQVEAPEGEPFLFSRSFTDQRQLLVEGFGAVDLSGLNVGRIGTGVLDGHRNQIVVSCGARN